MNSVFAVGLSPWEELKGDPLPQHSQKSRQTVITHLGLWRAYFNCLLKGKNHIIN